MMIKEYKIEKKLGEGVYGIAYKVKKDNNYYVLKQISLLGLTEPEKNDVKNEAKFLSKIKSKYVVKYCDSFEFDNKLNIVMEYCENGDLNTFIEKRKKIRKKLEEDEILKIFIKILLGLADIHKMKIIHRDLKSLNVFLKKDNDIRIGDFGIAKLLDKTFYAKTFIGTPYYLSPEICKDIPYNYKSDVWALGCILYELCTFEFPFTGKSQASLILNIINATPKDIGNYSPELKNLVKKLLNKDYKKRPDCINILKIPIINNKAIKLGLFKDINNSFNVIYPKEKKDVIPPFKEKKSADIAITIKPKVKSKSKDKNKKDNKSKIQISATDVNFYKNKKTNLNNNNNNYTKNVKPTITHRSSKNISDKKEIITKSRKELVTNHNNEIKESTCKTARIIDNNKNPQYTQYNNISDNQNNNSTNNIIEIKKIELLPCKERFEINSYQNNNNKLIEEDIDKENNQNNENITRIELLPCKDKNIRNNNNNTISQNLEDTLNQKFQKIEKVEINLEKEFFDDDTEDNNNKDNAYLVNEENKKERYINDFKIEESLKVDLDEMINEYDSNNSDEDKNAENELENLKEKIEKLKKDISKLIGEEKLKELIKIYSIGIKDDSKKQLVSEKLQIYIEKNFAKRKDKNKIYDIFPLFILECEYYDSYNKKNI